MLRVALLAFRSARDRHTNLAIAYNPVDLFVSATECVFWAAILDEQLRNRHEYRSFLNDHQAGSLIPGIRYIRNLKTHSLTMTFNSIPGKIFPVTYPVSGSEVVWLPFESLPRPQMENQHTPAQAQAYRDFMAGKPTRQTFATLDDGYCHLERLDRSPLAGQLPQFDLGQNGFLEG